MMIFTTCAPNQLLACRNRGQMGWSCTTHGEISHVRSRYRWEDNIKTGLNET